VVAVRDRFTYPLADEAYAYSPPSEFGTRLVSADQMHASDPIGSLRNQHAYEAISGIRDAGP
jgi:hypothetical protein